MTDDDAVPDAIRCIFGNPFHLIFEERIALDSVGNWRVCERCTSVFDRDGRVTNDCPKCGSEFTRKQRYRDIGTTVDPDWFHLERRDDPKAGQGVCGAEVRCWLLSGTFLERMPAM